MAVFVDACFSGADRNDQDLIIGQRSLVIPDLSEIERRVPVLSASTSKQISFGYDQQKHGLFTYFLLRGLRGEADGADGSEKDQAISLAELEAFTRKNVSRKAYELRNRDQTPQLIVPRENARSRILVQY